MKFHMNLYELLSTELERQIILYVSKVYETLTTESKKDSIPNFEYLGRRLCFLLHSARQLVLASSVGHGNKLINPD